MTLFNAVGLVGLFATASTVLASLFVKAKNKAVADNWRTVAESATARAEEATNRAAALQLRVDHLEEQVRVLIDTVTAKQSIEDLQSKVEHRFNDLTALVVEAITTAGVQRAPGSARRQP